jgi:hypothetical protein
MYNDRSASAREIISIYDGSPTAIYVWLQRETSGIKKQHLGLGWGFQASDLLIQTPNKKPSNVIWMFCIAHASSDTFTHGNRLQKIYGAVA